MRLPWVRTLDDLFFVAKTTTLIFLTQKGCYFCAHGGELTR
jgi:hypothetical protein